MVLDWCSQFAVDVMLMFAIMFLNLLATKLWLFSSYELVMNHSFVSKTVIYVFMDVQAFKLCII